MKEHSKHVGGEKGLNKEREEIKTGKNQAEMESGRARRRFDS